MRKIQSLTKTSSWVSSKKALRLLILSQNDTLDIDCSADADFAGLYGAEKPENPISAKSRSGWVVMVGGCPVTWASKMQTETALSTMQAEYVALSNAMRDLLSHGWNNIKYGFEEGRKDIKNLNRGRTMVHTLANLEPRRTMSRSKHFPIKYHWF